MKDRTRTPYLRLARECPEHAWWRLPVGTLIAVAVYFALTTVMVGMLFVASAASGDDGEALLDAMVESELSTASVGLLAAMLLLVAVMLPAVLIGRFAVGPRVGDLSSVEGRLRWRWLGVTTLLAFVVYGAVIVVAFATDSTVTSPSIDGQALVVVLMVLLVVPFQATAEEYVFRGQLMQMVGSWTRWAWVPIVVTTPLFVAGHVYELIGLVDVSIFGLTAAYLVIRTGGLEAAMAAHTANNVVLFVLEAFDVRVSGDLGVLDLLPTLVASGLMIAGTEVLFRRSGERRTRERLPDPTPKIPPPPVYWGPPPGYWPYPPQQPWAPPAGRPPVS